MIFKCDPELKIYAKGWYDYTDFSNAVGYWSNFLRTHKTKHPVGVLVADSITFSGMAFLLALYETKTSFVYLPPTLDYTNDEFEKLFDFKFQPIVVLGLPNHMKVPHLSTSTEDFFHAFQISKKAFSSSLEFSFDKDHEIFALTSGTTGKSKVIPISAVKEGRSIQTSIDLFFDPADVCLFSHDMTHVGVHTTAILPALFTVKKIFSLTTQEWPQFVDQATHCQWFAIMKDYYKLTPNIKKITFGGSKLSENLVEFIFSQAPDATIYDIYGLTESLPPVAIRKITKNNLPTAFEICQKGITFETIDNQLVVVDTVTGKRTPTGDNIKQIDATHFEFIGRARKAGRMNGHMVNQSDIGSMLAKQFPVKSFSIQIDGETLIIQVVENPEQFTRWCLDNKVEDFKIVTVDSIATAGGIKTINQTTT